MFGLSLKGASRITMDAASRIVGRHPGPIHRVLRTLNLAHMATGDKRTDLIAVDCLELVRAKIDELFVTGEATSLLGCSRAQLRRYARSGLIARFCDGGPTSPSFYLKESVERLAKLTAGLMIVSETPPNLVRLGSAAALLRLGPDVPLIMLSNGELRARALLVGQDGVHSLSNILVSLDEIRKAKHNRLVDGLSNTAAAYFLRLPRDSLGKLKVFMFEEIGRSTTDLLSIEDVLAIRSRFVLCREITATYPHATFNRRKFVDSMSELGIDPVLKGRLRTTVFNRAEIEKVLGPIVVEPLRK